MTELDIERLKAAALAATPGEWKSFVSLKTNTFSVHTSDDNRKGDIVGWTGFEGTQSSKKKVAANARYIAAANPSAIGELIRELEREKIESASLRYALELAKQLPRNTAPPAPVSAEPLSEEKIEAIAKSYESGGFGTVGDKGLTSHWFDPDGLASFVCAIEQAHGITATTASRDKNDS